MCRSKSDSGRRCVARNPELCAASHNARRRANRAARAAGAAWARANLSEEAAQLIAGSSPAAAREVALSLGVPSHVIDPAAVLHSERVPERIVMGSLSDYGFAPSDALRDSPSEDALDSDRFTSSLWTMSLTSQQSEAIQDYTANDFDVINGALKRGVLSSLPAEYGELVEHIDTALEQATRAPRPRVSLDWTPDEVRDKVAEVYPVGTSVTYPTYQSTSLVPSVAEGFSRGQVRVLFEMMTREGASLEDLTDVPGEHEVLLARGTSWRVVGVSPHARAMTEDPESGDLVESEVVMVHLVQESLAVGEASGTAPGLGLYRKTFDLPT